MLCLPLYFNVFVSLTEHVRHRAGVNYSSHCFPNTVCLTFSNHPYDFVKANSCSFLGYPFLSYFQYGELPTHPARHCLTGYSLYEPILWESAPSLPQGSPVTALTVLHYRVCSAFLVPAWEPFKAGTKSFYPSFPLWLPSSLLGDDSHPQQAGLGKSKVPHPTDSPSWACSQPSLTLHPTLQRRQGPFTRMYL